MATQRELALRMIPVLIRWAQATWDKPHYYGQLSAAVGHNSPQIGGVMGVIQDILDDLSKTSRKKIPTLNSLAQNKDTGLPSDGFDYVIPNYSKLSSESKRGEVRNLNYKAHIYDWSWVLKALNLKPAKLISDNELKTLKMGSYGSGGEGKEHKALKKYIFDHPESIGISGVKSKKVEYDLLSGDKLDVYFECRRNRHIAVEVKPKTSPDKDILRGVFQCVKYKSVMDAMRVVDNANYDNETILVLAGSMPDYIKQYANDLGISYIDEYNY